jgi:ribosome maturation factor RimP
MAYTPLEEKIEAIIRPSLEGLGFTLVRVRLLESVGKHQKTLQIMAERTSDGSMLMDDCVEVSRTISALLDVEDPIDSEYTLEVGSPGMDRPLLKLADFEKYKGYTIKLSTTESVEGRKKFRGILEGVDGDDILLVLNDGSNKRVRVPHALVHASNLIITDEMIKAASRKAATN